VLRGSYGPPLRLGSGHFAVEDSLEEISQAIFRFNNTRVREAVT
jgi:hypothetical protein